MKIYHYTSLENLVLILKNRTIRFNRLDQMDDPCEHHFFSHGLNWSPYTYVSCWTETPDENIPLWHMYSKGGAGIRIGLDKECIDWEKCPHAVFARLNQTHHPPLCAKQVRVSVRFNPISIYGIINTAECYHPIEYIKESLFNEMISIGANRTVINKTLTEGEFQKHIGLYKDEKWAFQNEVRFRIFAVPQIIEEKEMSFEEFQTIIANETPNPFTYIDLPLKDSAFDNLEITLGPNATESTFVIMELLIKEFAPSAKIIKSTLNSNTWFY